MERKTARRAERHAATGRVTLSWTDSQGVSRFVRGTCIDISTFGIQVETRDPVDVRAYVNLRCTELRLDATASVRYCARKGMRYRVGMEFGGSMRWSPPQADKQDLV